MTSNSSDGPPPSSGGAPSPPQGAERRTARRVPNHPDDHVIIDRIRFRLQNWSRNGLLFGPMASPPAMFAKIDIKVAVMINGDRVRFEAIGEVLRIAEGSVAVRYQVLTSEAAPILRHYFDALG